MTPPVSAQKFLDPFLCAFLKKWAIHTIWTAVFAPMFASVVAEVAGRLIAWSWLPNQVDFRKLDFNSLYTISLRARPYNTFCNVPHNITSFLPPTSYHGRSKEARTSPRPGGRGEVRNLWRWLKERPARGGPPNWAWCITWGIMLFGVVLNLIALLMRFQ